MLQHFLTAHQDSRPDEILTTMKTMYYKPIEEHGSAAYRCLNEITALPEELFPHLYLSLSKNVLKQMHELITERYLTWIPLAKTLYGDRGKDLLSVNVPQVDFNIKQNRALNNKIKESFFRLQNITPPLYTSTAFPESYADLRNNMTMVDTLFSRMILVEEACLLPKFIEIQNQIHGEPGN